MLRHLIALASFALLVMADTEGMNRSDAAETAAAPAATKQVALKVGDKAPLFEATTDQGKPWKAAEHYGKKIVVVSFYPADMTGGCTAQACAYRDALKELKRDDVEVVGVSGDSVENHQKFKQEYELPFTLLADPDGKAAKLFGVKTVPGGKVTPKFKDGQTHELVRGITAMRWTYLIDRDCKIADVSEIRDAGKDPQRVLAIIEKLAKTGQAGM